MTEIELSDEMYTRPSRDEETTADADEDSPTASAPMGQTQTCPECEGTVTTRDNEDVCTSCGLVIEDDEIDRGPEWRAYNSKEQSEKSRVGSPTTVLMHDDGLSTNISWQMKDGYGNSLSGKKRQKMKRLRTWNRRFKTRDAKERNLRQALGEIQRMAAALNLPEDTQETAAVIYRRALSEDLLPGRSIEGISTASLYAAARTHGTPRTLDEFARVSRIEKDRFEKAYWYVNKELNLEIEPADPTSYLPRFVDNVEAAIENDPDSHANITNANELETVARDLVKAAQRANVTSGKAPTSIAAAAVYAASLLTNQQVTQRHVSEATDVTTVTIRNRYQELLEETDYCDI